MANIKISELNPLLTVEDADVLPIVDNAVTKKVTAAILRSYTQGNSVLLTGAQTVAGIKTFTSQLASSVATGTAPFSVASTTKVTNLNADLLDGLSSADFQATLSGTGIVKSTAGTISYLTDNSANWDTAYNDKINSAAVTGSGTNTLTLTQQDAGTITATWVNGTLIREIRNTTGATLTKGTIVYISGATGNKPTVTKAIATTDETSSQTFGFVQENIANNANGYVVIIGDLIGVDTSAFTEGDQLYLSSTVAGAFTDVKQYAPNHLVYVGIVTRAHPTLGQIEVNISNGFEMDELHNVAAQNPSNGDILQYVTSTGLWTKIAGTTSAISEGSNLYFTNARSRSAFSESVTGLDYNSTTGVLSTTSGYGIPTTASQTTWDTAYNDSIVSAAVTGTTTKTLTLNQQDGGSVTASWTDDNTDAVSSVFGRTGAVVATSGDYTTTQVTEGTNLYFTDARARAAISLTTTGTSGAATYSGGVLNIPQYQAALTNPITGTGTTNYLPKFTGTSALGNSLIYDNGSNVYLNTSSGTYRFEANAGSSQYINARFYGSSHSLLQIESTTAGYQALLAFSSPTRTWSTGLQGDGRFNIYDNTANAERFTITSAGNVGIGTTSPLSKFVVSNGGAQGMEFGYSSGLSANYIQSINRSTYVAVDLAFFVAESGAGIKFYTETVERLNIKNSGNVLIGTTTDAGYKLDVNGTARVSGRFTASSSGEVSQFISSITSLYNTYRANGSDVGYIGNGTGLVSGGSATSFGIRAESDLIFAIANATKFSIDNTGAATFSSSVTANGNLSVGGTNQDSLLTINGSAGTSHARFREGSTTIGFVGGADGIISGQAGKLAIRGEAGLVLSGQGNSADVIISNTGAATFSSSVTATTAKFTALPTSSAGLSAGDIWNDGGTLKIV